MPHISRIIAQNEEILNEQIKINTRLEMIEARMESIETKSDVQLDDFKVDKINNPSEFNSFLKCINKDKVLKAKVVSF